MVEGVENNVPGQYLNHHWQGGNLEGVLRYPVRLSVRNKLVYSPHEYGSGVHDQPYFSDKNFPQNLLHRWQIGFHYISSQNRAPIFVGEFGGRLVNNEKETIWFNKFVKYIHEKNLSFAFWSWNPNSADTGGILLDDWQNVDLPKQKILSQLLPVKFTDIVATTIGEPKKSEQQIQESTSVLSSSAQLKVTTEIYADWQTGFCTKFKITNHSSETVQNWQMKFYMKQAKIKNSWNANFELGRIILYELTRHSDHHYLASKKYQLLDHHDDSPQLPLGYPASILMALVPPLWFNVMNKKVLFSECPSYMKCLQANIY